MIVFSIYRKFATFTVWKKYQDTTLFLQILPSNGEVKRPGGYQNISLQIGPPVTYDDAGRYICLVNNPEGHAHKEMFLEVGHFDSKTAVEGYREEGNFRT